MTDLFEQTVQVLVSLAMSADAETLDDITLHREVDALIDAYLVWTRTRRPAGFRPQGYNERDELAQAFWERCHRHRSANASAPGSLGEMMFKVGA